MEQISLHTSTWDDLSGYLCVRRSGAVGDVGAALLPLPWGECAAGCGQSRNDCIAFAECSEGFGWKVIHFFFAAALGKKIGELVGSAGC